MSLHSPISYRDKEGSDSLTGSTQNKPELVTPSVPAHSIYAKGSASKPGVTTSSLYEFPLGASVDPLLLEKELNQHLEDAHRRLQKEDMGLMVVSGYISPEDQQEKFAQLFEQYLGGKDSPEAILETGFRADNVGSVAEIIEDENYTAAFERAKGDKKLMKGIDAFENGMSSDEKLKWYLTFRANHALKTENPGNIKLDLSSAVTVHNLGHSANIVLTDAQGNVLPTGRPMDVPLKKDDINLQKWTAFEGGIQAATVEEIARMNPLYAKYLQETGEQISEAQITLWRDRTRVLFNAVMPAENRTSLDVYAGETGHVSVRKPSYPTRETVAEAVSDYKQTALVA